MTEFNLGIITSNVLVAVQHILSRPFCGVGAVIALSGCFTAQPILVQVH